MVLRRTKNDERGQVALLLIAAVLLASVALAGLAGLGRAAADRAAAQTAADAAALAGAAEGEGAARAVAEANGAHLVAYEQQDLEVEVVVARRGHRARARARWEPIARRPAPPVALRPSGVLVIP